jgi:rhodanese-related sulfurtransferase
MKSPYRCFWVLTVIVLCLTVFEQNQSIGTLAQSEKSKVGGVAFISAEELKVKLASNEPLVIIDVRSSTSYAHSDKKIRGAVHVKLRRLEHRLTFPPLKDVPRDRAVITYCACPADEASISAARVMLENGFKNVWALKGGWNEWLKVSGQTETKQRGL